MPKPSVPIKIGDKTYQFRYTFNSLIRLQEELGVSIGELDKIFPTQPEEGKEGEIKMTADFLPKIRSLFWAGLVHENKDLTLEEAGDLVDEVGGIMEAVKPLMEAFGNAFPVAEDVKKK